MSREAVEFQLVDVRFFDRHQSTSEHAFDDPSLRSPLFLEICCATGGAREFVVYLFGRCMDGKSVCVHVTGWKPKLFYARSEGVGAETLRSELQKLMGFPYVGCDFEVTAVVRFTASGATLDADGLREETPYWCVAFPNGHAYRRACYAQHNAGVSRTSPIATPHHTKPTLEAKFLVDTGLVPSGWVRVPAGVQLQALVSTCSVEVAASVEQLTFVDRDESAPLRMLAFDIECVSDDGTFPKATNDMDTVCQVSVCTWVLTSTEHDADALITQGTCAPIDGVRIVQCANEGALLNAFRAELIAWDADVVLQFNGYTFDIPYLACRATSVPAGSKTRAEPCEAYMYCGKFRFKDCKLRQKPLKSAGLGANEICYVDMDGRSNFDIFLWYKTNFKEATYGLNDIAQRVLHEKKNDFSYKLIKPYFYGTDAERATLGKYCVQDSVLLRKLARKLTFVEGDLEQSRVSMVLLERLQTHGQGTKVVSQMTAACERVDRIPFVLDMPHAGRDDDAVEISMHKYEGATVKEPITGYYKEHPVVVVDFSSLYPSAMIAHNICKSTLVRRACDHHKPGVVPHRVSATTTHRFSTLNKGLLPAMLDELLTLRKKVKGRMNAVEAELDSDGVAGPRRLELEALLQVLNKRQLAVKVSANSIYGFMGAEECGQYPSREAAETTTSIGRIMLEESTQRAGLCARSLRRVDGQPVGDLTVVYGDTDSLMFTLSNVFEPADGADAGEAIAADITAMYHARGERAKKLEFEKIYFPWMLFSKKRYGGILWNRHRDGHVVSRGASHSGTANKRRDSCGFVQKMYDAIINPLLYERDDDKALRVFHEHMTRLLDGDIDFDDFVITKAVRDEYKTAAVKWACHGSVRPALAHREIPFAHVLSPKLRAVGLMSGDARRASYEVTRQEVAALKAAYASDKLAVMAKAEACAGPAEGTPRTLAAVPARFRKLEEVGKLDVMTTDFCIVRGLYFMTDEDAVAHMRVVEKQRARDPGSEVRSGDRVPMIYVLGPTGAKARDLVEDVEYAKATKAALNIDYYIEHQIENPISLLLNVLHPEPAKLFKSYREEYKHRRNAQSRMDAFCKTKAESAAAAVRAETSAATGRAGKALAAIVPIAAKRAAADTTAPISKWFKKPAA